MEGNKMLKKINACIAKFGMWIFLVAAVYRVTFWIIDMVKGFKADSVNSMFGGGSANGVYALFNGLFGMIISLVTLAVILEISRKIAEKYTPEELGSKPVNNNTAPMNNYNAAPQTPVPPQAPVQPQVPYQPQAPVQPAANVWYCAGCGTQNGSNAAFCAKCGKPR